MASVFSRAKLFTIDTSISAYATTQANRSQNHNFDLLTLSIFWDDKMN